MGKRKDRKKARTHGEASTAIWEEARGGCGTLPRRLADTLENVNCNTEEVAAAPTNPLPRIDVIRDENPISAVVLTLSEGLIRQGVKASIDPLDAGRVNLSIEGMLLSSVTVDRYLLAAYLTQIQEMLV